MTTEWSDGTPLPAAARRVSPAPATLRVRRHEGRVTALDLRFAEAPRLFEKLLEAREFGDVVDLSSRHSGVAATAYQLSAAEAIEDAFGLRVDAGTRDARRLLLCGEWILSHADHIHRVALPNALGYPDSLAMAAAAPEEMRRGQRLLALGNELLSVIGGRSIHPLSVTVGGWRHLPSVASIAALRAHVRLADADALALVQRLAAIEPPKMTQDFISVALDDGDAYPMFGTRLRTDQGRHRDTGLALVEFEPHVRETAIADSPSRRMLLDGVPYLSGPLARMNLGHTQLSAELRALLHTQGNRFPSANPGDTLLARGIELLHALRTAADLLTHLHAAPGGPVKARAGRGLAAIEAAHGMLYQRFDFAADGRIEQARILPPDHQNHARMEAELGITLGELDTRCPAAEWVDQAQTVIRRYAPSLACGPGDFLDLQITDI